ncbi:hypothetical protein N7466_003953 [Penicillium verhagenii]|uniref:uncharacterized protein n=1 Tax=Penicillium verhagenii TaxID=1562060 RepID=UPI002545708C|nr:uncharacterized protein N7466_003953 [Penicillium verhagenii]KAJ5934406.1 hypothetical protein N7466_003953 [Penicillium verhagenii]
MSLADSGSDAPLPGAEHVQGFNSGKILPLPASDLAKITRWLQPTPYDFERSEYSRHSASHLLGTGAWFKSTQAYQQWHSGDNGLLWVKGIPGSGKSVMAASIIKELQKEDVPVVYFFFRMIIEANHKPIVALRDWLCQVLDYSPPLQVKLQKYVEKDRSPDSLSPADLWSDLMMALQDFPRAYCVTDALDEMDLGHDDFLKSLVDLGQWRPKNFKVLMTSRPIARLETSLRPFSIPQIRLEERLVDLDIAAYVQHKLRGLSITQENRSAIQEAIPGRANGIFLYAKMSMDVFLEPGANVQEALNALPTDLNTMYNNLLLEHSRRSNVPSELQLLILQFVTHATRPLRLLEMAEMLNINSKCNQTLKETKALVRTACGPLLEVLPDETISVIHHTFTEFLNGYARSRSKDTFEYPIFEAGSTNLRLAMECLSYMRARCLDEIEITLLPTSTESYGKFLDRKMKEKQEVRLRFPFLEYAADNWYKHARLAEGSNENLEVFHDALDTFFTETHRYTVWLGLAWPGQKIDGVTPLHVAAWIGLSKLAKYILSKGGIIQNTKSAGLPISWAASYNHGNVIRVFVDHGADPDAEVEEGRKPMHLAAKSNHVDAVKALLAAGVSPLTPKTRNDTPLPTGCCLAGPVPITIGHTPLMYACHAGHLETVLEFVKCLENVEDMHRALHWAAEKGRSSIVELILQQPRVDVNTKVQGKNALFLACKSADLKTLKALIKAGAEPNALCQNFEVDVRGIQTSVSSAEDLPKKELCDNARGYTALHALCTNSVYGEQASSQATECVKALVQAGADVHAKDPRGLTALHYAYKSSIAWMEPLLDAGADPAAEDHNGETALHFSSVRGNEALSLLLKCGKVDINKPRAQDGMTPLLCRLADMLSEDHKTIELLAYRPNLNATDWKGDGPLHLAMRRSSVNHELIDKLLAAGADPNLKNAAGNTPLHQTSTRLSQEQTRALVQGGADLELCNNKGQSVLFAQLSPRKGVRDYSEILGHFASEGARLDTRDSKGRTLWHCSIENLKTLSLLQSLGVDHLVSDNDGNTPLHEVVNNHSFTGKRKVLERLMEMGMDINQPNHQGRTVLHAVCSRDLAVDLSKYSVDTILDYVLEQCRCLTVSDHEGVQPLHVAATISETFVHKLLNAGANLCATTHDKMTVLHLAARARQSGIVDMVLSRATSLAKQAYLEFVNSQDKDGRTPLHYACRSGRPETVKSLLEAGAVVNVLDINKHSPLAMCGEFEKEASLWDLRVPLNPRPMMSSKGINAAGLTLKDDTRPFYDRSGDGTDATFGRINSEHDTTRLQEIINMLIKHGLDLDSDHKSLENAWKNAAQPEYGYTISCLPSLPKRYPSPLTIYAGHPQCDDPDRELKILIAVNCRNTIKATLENIYKPADGIEERRNQNHTPSPRQLSAEKALALRYYDLFEELSGGADSPHVPGYKGYTSLNMLARRGFVEILDRLCTREITRQLDGTDWTSNPDENDIQQCSEPLVISACKRKLPNMDVLKLVVEDYGANINAKKTEHVVHHRKHRPSITSTSGALHDLAVGKSWWHVGKAMPYLIRMGADVDIRNRNRETPLIVALKSCHPFSREATEALIRAGADVNAIDADGNTCLSTAGDDMGIIELLIAHGAEVNPSAILSALDLAKIDLLEVLLSRSGSSILKQPLPKTISRNTGSGHFKTLRAGTLPLLYAAVCSPKNELLEILLKHGADPYATFDQQQYQILRRGAQEEPKTFPVTSATIIHELLSGGHIVDPFFNLTSLDIERRDENGCTLILAASKNFKQKLGMGTKPQNLNATDCLLELVNRGANVMAQDNGGRTILHHIESLIDVSSTKEALQTAVAASPNLVHQIDCKNETALHYALRLRILGLIEFLLDNGADPLQPDKNGDTALHHFARYLDHKPTKNLFKRFLKAGAEINARNNIGETPMFNLLKQNNDGLYGSAEDQTYKNITFEFFLECGADIFARNNDGSTLLHLLAGIKLELRHIFQCYHPGSGRVGVGRFKRLMDMGLDPMIEDKVERTSIDVAAACENELILRLFKNDPLT